MSLPRVYILTAMLAFHVTTVVAQSQSPSSLGGDSLSMEQQIEVGDILTKEAGAALHGGNFPLSVNGKVPTHIELRPMPENINSIAPQFRNHSYIVVDEQIAIVEPESRNIVAVPQRWQRPSDGAAAPHTR